MERVVLVSSAATAEMAKLLENTFRHINIAGQRDGVSVPRAGAGRVGRVWEVIEAAATKPFGFLPFHPGPGVGGHCIPIDPMYLSWKVRQHGVTSRFISLSRDINAAMPAHVVARVQDLLNDASKPVRGSRVLVVGLTYKADVADLRESPAVPVIAGLRRLGARVVVSDPLVAGVVVEGEELACCPDPLAAAGECDCLVLLVGHRGVDHEALAAAAPLTLDTRRVLGGAGGPEVHGL